MRVMSLAGRLDRGLHAINSAGLLLPTIAGRLMPTIKERLLCGVASLTLLDASAVLAEPVRSWTGFYIGGHAGYSWGSVNGDTTYSVLTPGTPFFPRNTVIFSSVQRDFDPSGGLGGVQLGYNFQSARFVYGIETDLSWTGQHDSSSFSGRKTVQFEDFNYQETTAAKLKYMGTVRGRLGFLFGDFLPYVTGGFAWGRMAMDLDWRLTQNFCTPCVASFSGSQAHTLAGWTAGAGIEYSLNQLWSLKAEYLYVDLNEATFFSNVQGGGSFGMHDHILRFGINFRP
jgi:outer membrane immunogenic protein